MRSNIYTIFLIFLLLTTFQFGCSGKTSQPESATPTACAIRAEVDENGNRTQSTPSANVVASRSKKASKRQTGFVAQDVEELANKLGYDFSGVVKPENEESVYSLRYAEFVVPIVKAMQEQQELIVDLL